MELILDGKTPTVKILYNSENPNRVDAYALIAESASQAGFKMVDGGSPDWEDLLYVGMTRATERLIVLTSLEELHRRM